jgi:transglutaminase-like putative cysteine protease
MQRRASANMILHAKADAQLVLSLAVADATHAEEKLIVRVNEEEVPVREVLDQHGTRLHLAHVSAGRIAVSYDVTVDGHNDDEPEEEIYQIRYLRQSRYCESDQLGPTARDEFSGLAGAELLNAVRTWVNGQLHYVPGYSRTSDGAIHALIARQGVCRDFAHLAIALLRSLDVPARLASVYAPQLSPMDFHAVAEAYIEGRWVVIDPTGRAPRQPLMRIATGRDAADIAWLSVIGGQVNFGSLSVTAECDEEFTDDHIGLVSLGA